MSIKTDNQRIALIKAYHDALGAFLADARAEHSAISRLSASSTSAGHVPVERAWRAPAGYRR